jgi:hypothetical protein
VGAEGGGGSTWCTEHVAGEIIVADANGETVGRRDTSVVLAAGAPYAQAATEIEGVEGASTPRRITPPAILADFVVKAKERSDGRGDPKPLEDKEEPRHAHVASEKTAGSSTTLAMESEAATRPRFETD